MARNPSPRHGLTDSRATGDTRRSNGSDSMIIDIHGHYTTAPKALETWRNRQIAGITNPAEMPKASELRISDDELRESIESNQLRLMCERGLDVTIFSPRASFMAHHIGDVQVSGTWA